METSTFILEKDFASQGFTHVIGTDEVGRGPLCGPVVACAAMLKYPYCHPGLSSESMSTGELDSWIPDQVRNDKRWDLIRDSKKLSEKQREEIFDFIGQHFHLGIGLCDHETIDRINILEASFLAMKKAIQQLMRNVERETHSKTQDTCLPDKQARNKNQTSINSQDLNNNLCHPELVSGSTQIPDQVRNDRRFIILVDGNKIIPNLSMEQYAVIGGDKLVKSISAASIVAKVTRDRMMKEFAEKYPGYGLEKHMGYGTKIHMEALKKLGPCPIHRKTFGPVKKSLKMG
ncbi:MAG: ribonuclease HII [Candidatus Moranbacteria bacterium]|nr:ribonuclease HII [Candidatus Moranbacteria bacterium]